MSFAERLMKVFPGKSMAEMARDLEVPHSTIRNYINQDRLPAADVLIKIAGRTNVSLNWLLTGEGPMKIGGVKEFDLERSVELTDDWRQVMVDWYKFEGGEMPDTLGASFMGGWKGLAREQKIDAIRDFKKLLDLTIEDD